MSQNHWTMEFNNGDASLFGQENGGETWMRLQKDLSTSSSWNSLFWHTYSRNFSHAITGSLAPPLGPIVFAIRRGKDSHIQMISRNLRFPKEDKISNYKFRHNRSRQERLFGGRCTSPRVGAQFVQRLPRRNTSIWFETMKFAALLVLTSAAVMESRNLRGHSFILRSPMLRLEDGRPRKYVPFNSMTIGELLKPEAGSPASGENETTTTDGGWWARLPEKKKKRKRKPEKSQNGKPNEELERQIARHKVKLIWRDENWNIRLVE